MFSDEATEFIFQLPKRQQKRVISFVRQLADHPFVRSDYVLLDESGRRIEHLLLDDFVFAFWVDDAVRELRITDIDDAS